jgi:hypothetical protein
MRRSVENAEHVGLFCYPSRKKARHAPKTQVQHPQRLLFAFGVRSNTTTMLDTNSHHPFTGIVCFLFTSMNTTQNLYNMY